MQKVCSPVADCPPELKPLRPLGELQIYPQHSRKSQILEYARRQYKLLCDGVRDVRISDAGIYGWELGGGQW